MTRDLDPRLVFAKTESGAAEVAARAHKLSISERRILILLDGRRRLADLPPFARPGELAPIVDRLESCGLIALAGIAEDVAPREDDLRRQKERAVQARLLTALDGAFEREVGAAGLILEARLRDCVNLEVFRRVLREAIDTVERMRGREAAERLLVLVRPLYAELVAP